MFFQIFSPFYAFLSLRRRKKTANPPFRMRIFYPRDRHQVFDLQQEYQDLAVPKLLYRFSSLSLRVYSPVPWRD